MFETPIRTESSNPSSCGCGLLVWTLPRPKNMPPACFLNGLSNPIISRKKRHPFGCLFFLGWIMGFEPTTFRATIWRANQLCYIHHILFCWKNGTPEGTRTPDLLLRRQLLYPAELLAHFYGAGDGNRTRVSSLEGWCSTIELHPQVPAIQLEDNNISPSQMSTDLRKKLLVKCLSNLVDC